MKWKFTTNNTNNTSIDFSRGTGQYAVEEKPSVHHVCIQHRHKHETKSNKLSRTIKRHIQTIVDDGKGEAWDT